MSTSIKPLFGRLLLSILFLAFLYHLGYQVDQTEFHWILVDYSALFGIYLLLVQPKVKITMSSFIGLALLARGLLLFSTPNLSDDIYRFLWDGYLIAQGLNPLQYVPAEIIQDGILDTPYLSALFPLLNSPDYYTVYPPLAQITFLIAAVFATSLSAQIIWIKVILFLFEVGNIWVIGKLLKQLGMKEHLILVYALNPLIIMEIMGNVHYEGVLLFFILWSIWLGIRSRPVVSGVAMASSIASKLTSAMYLPLWIRYAGWRKAFLFYVVIGIATMLYFTPFVNIRFLQNFGDSINLYFQSFEFNASLYYIARWIGFQYKGYNMIADIGPLLSLMTVLAIIFFSFRQQLGDTPQLFRHLLMTVTVYLLATTTVHPWYVIVPLTFSVFTQWNYAILWSYVAIWSYSHYHGGVIGERMGWLWGEYLILGSFVVLEWVRFKKVRKAI